MTIQILCPKCGATLSFPDEQAGQEVPCAECGELVSVFNPNVEEFDIRFDAEEAESDEHKPRGEEPE